MISTTRALIVASPQFGDHVTKETTRIGVDLSQRGIWYKWVAWRLQVSLAIWSSELFLALSGRTVTFRAKPAGSKPWEGHVAAAQKKSHQWCLTLTPNNTETIERMTCHCFLRPIRRDLPSCSYTTTLGRILALMLLFLEKWEAIRYHPS